MEDAEAIATATGPPDLPTAPMEKLDGFSDRLSPMLVKELRQGLRTYTFVSVFLALQGLLTIVLLIAGVASAHTSSDGAGTIVSKIVFCFYALAILVIQPLRGISSLSSEIKGNTIDLMVLTRLSAWRIVWGKWSSIVSQSALILFAVLPYLMLRYFFGGMQLFSELFLMLYLFAISSTLTAFTIGISALGSALIRGIVVVVGSCLLGGWILFTFTPELETYLNSLSLVSRDSFLFFLGLLVLIIYVGYFFLELGTSFIAPNAENRATHKRLIGLAVATLSFIGAQFHDLNTAFAAVAIVGILLAFDFFSETPRFPASITRPFLRFGPIGKLLGRFLYPGWPSGSLFFLFFASLISLFTYFSLSLRGGGPQSWTLLGIIFGIMAFPAAMIQLFARKSEQRHSLYLSFSLIGWLLTTVITLLHEEVGENLILWCFGFLPMIQLVMTEELGSGQSAHILPFFVWGVTGLYWSIILMSALPHFKAIRIAEGKQLTLEEDPTI